ncbi:MAG: penicillin-binding transpeptidase domain-containing protein [Oscillospiraceae bacterium]|nr:penicillin-binding transpeptidase domain-containing protein [Oscillospiraceae bacterium]
MSEQVANTTTRGKKSRSLIFRTLFLQILCGIAAFSILVARLYNLQITQNDYYESKALQFQLSQTSLNASRGTIFDVNGNILAISASTVNVFISPYEIARDGYDIMQIANGLSDILNVSVLSIVEMSQHTDSHYQVVMFGVEDLEAQMVREFVRGNKLGGVYMEPSTRRYYPNDNLAAQVLGFTGRDNVGLDGLEERYDSQLTGVSGRTINLRNALGRNLMMSQYNDYYTARNGDDITLTIDSSIQYYIEKHLAQAIIDYDVINGASCIAMDPRTGAILGMANYPSFNPNDFLSIGERELERLSLITDDEEYQAALYQAQVRQWRNRALSDAYEPGSVFKIMTLAMAIEENVVSLNHLYDCQGYMEVLGREEDEPLHCWNIYGHGEQTIVQAMKNSCNIVCVEMALRVRAQTFYKYIDAFGLFDRTGLDDTAESRSLWWDESVFFNRNNQAQLASASFGQTFKVTPIQMITAAAATINGGYLMEPYIVKQITDGSGNIIEAAEPRVLRQVISEETSAIVRSILEEVVSSGTGRNASVRGYRVGGKTGTSEFVEQLSQQAEQVAQNEIPTVVKDYIVSFIGFAPAEDPQIIILLLLDTPSHETDVIISGGAMAAPVVGNMLADILPLSLGIKAKYSEEDLGDINVDTPSIINCSIADAQVILDTMGFEYIVIGDGDVVTNQLPAPNAYVVSGTRVMLFADADIPVEPVLVPSLHGMSYGAAKDTLEAMGLFVRTSGAPKSDNRAEVSVQSLPAGELHAYGSIVELTLINKDAIARN